MRITKRRKYGGTHLFLGVGFDVQPAVEHGEAAVVRKSRVRRCDPHPRHRVVGPARAALGAGEAEGHKPGGLKSCHLATPPQKTGSAQQRMQGHGGGGHEAPTL